MDATMKLLDFVQKRFHFAIEYSVVPAGDSALKEFGEALPQKSVDQFSKADACLKGPVGETIQDINQRLRFDFDLYANIRPAISCPGITPPALRPDIDITVIRENSEGFYRALESEIEPGIWTSTGVFTEKGAKRIAEVTFQYAKKRTHRNDHDRKVTLATKANIFRKTHSMYLRIFREVAQRYSEIKFDHVYADALCARLVREPQNFDVVVSENLLADLISDLAGQIAGGLGMTPGTNINYETKHAYFEPTHGSAPDIAGKNIANPIGQIRSAKMMLEYLALVNDDPRLGEAATSIESGIQTLLNSANKKILPVEVGGKAGPLEIAETIISSIPS
jgi:isocitrate/isopropylmalate dehydrogenase